MNYNLVPMSFSSERSVHAGRTIVFFNLICDIFKQLYSERAQRLMALTRKRVLWQIVFILKLVYKFNKIIL